MDIKEVKELQAKSAHKILEILDMFESLTGCSVYDVNLLIETPMGSGRGRVVDVSLEVRI